MVFICIIVSVCLTCRSSLSSVDTLHSSSAPILSTDHSLKCAECTRHLQSLVYLYERFTRDCNLTSISFVFMISGPAQLSYKVLGFRKTFKHCPICKVVQSRQYLMADVRCSILKKGAIEYFLSTLEHHLLACCCSRSCFKKLLKNVISVAVLAVISLRSPRKLFNSIIKKFIYRMKVSKKQII